MLRLVTWITVEPVQFLYCLMFSISGIVRDNLFIDKVCLIDLQFPDEVCYNLTHKNMVPKNMSEAVQKRVTELTVYDGILVALPSVLFCLFVGAWSDANGRKLLIILPFVGNLLSFLAYILNYHFFYELPTLHLLWGSVVGLSGGYICLNLGLYGYVSDISSAEDRTMRLSILNGVFSGGYIVGTALGGKIFKAYENYYVNFGISIGIGLVGLIVAMFIKESVRRDETVVQKSFFDLENVKQSFQTTFKPRQNSGRVHVILLVVNFAIFMFCLNTNHFDYLLSINKYSWDAADFSYYVSIQRTCRLVGLFLILPILSRVFKLGDALIASMGTVLSVIGYTLMAFGTREWLGPNGDWPVGWIMYLSAILQFNSIITVTIRSQCTKEVERNEIGRIFAIVALGQAIVPLISNPLFGGIYKATIGTFPGAYLLTISGMLLFVLASSIYMFCNQRRHTAEQQLIEDNI